MNLTIPQRNALHLWFRQIANELNAAGWDMRKTLKPGVEIPWTEDSVKTHIFKEVMKVMFDKESTNDLTTGEVSQVYEVVDRHLSQSTGVHVPFPCEEKP